MLTINNLTKLYKNSRGIKNITMDIADGDVVGLLGPNGSGKTTLMKAILGLIRPDSGEIKVFGLNSEEGHEEIMRRTGALIESPAIYREMSAYRNMVLASKGRRDKDEIMRLLKMVRLYDYRNDKARRFSLGMKQRLGLAEAFLGNPDLVVLDEPVNGLDIEGVMEVRELILKMAKERGTTFIISSHIASEIEKTCNKAAIIYDGELVKYDTVKNLTALTPSLEDSFLEIIKEYRGEVEL